MVADGISLCFAALGHHITNIDLHGFAGLDGIHNAVHQKIRDNAGVETAGGQDDQVRLPDGLQRIGQGLWVRRAELYAPQATVFLLHLPTDAGLPCYPAAVFKFALQADIGIGHRQNPARNGQHLAQTRHGLVKAGHDAVEGS